MIHQPGHSAGLLSTTKHETTTMNLEEIASMQSAATIKFEVAKKIVILLTEAEAEFDTIEHDLNWREQLEVIQRIVFDD